MNFIEHFNFGNFSIQESAAVIPIMKYNVQAGLSLSNFFLPDFALM